FPYTTLFRSLRISNNAPHMPERYDQAVTLVPMSLVRRALGTLIHRAWAAVREAGAITPRTPAGHAFRHLGDGAKIAFPPGAIFGEEWIEIGAHTLIGERVSLSCGMWPGADLGPDSIL